MSQSAFTHSHGHVDLRNGMQSKETGNRNNQKANSDSYQQSNTRYATMHPLEIRERDT